MYKKILVFVAAALVCAAFAAHADKMSEKGKAAKMEVKAKTTTVTGEIVDTSCYLGHGARGEKHAACAAKCINSNGAPMGLLTEDGTLWLLTPDHDNLDPYNALKGMAAKTVTVTGMAMERSGVKGLDVMSYKAAATETGGAESTKKSSGY